MGGKKREATDLCRMKGLIYDTGRPHGEKEEEGKKKEVEARKKRGGGKALENLLRKNPKKKKKKQRAMKVTSDVGERRKGSGRLGCRRVVEQIVDACGLYSVR